VNRPIRKVVVFCALIFAVLLVNATVVQVGEAHSLTSNAHNGRVLIDSYERQRGDIIVDNAPVAESTATTDALKYLRVYPAGSLYADITGYYSLLSDSGIERSENGILSGSDSRISLSISRIGQLLSGATPQGGDVYLTLDGKAQKLAAQLLGNRRGAVVAMDPRTGAILAMVSSPTYDPNALTSHDANADQKAYDGLVAQGYDPLSNRATQETYPPGSTFKLIDTAAALSSGRYTPQTLVDSPGSIRLPGTDTTLSNYAGESCGAAQITLTRALTVSCNTAYANVGLSLGVDALRAEAQAFGFGRTIDDLGIAQNPSTFGDADNQAQTAQSAIGQYNVAATPLQMCMVAAAIANGGVEMTPYLVSKITSPTLKTIETTQPTVFANPINATVASELTTMMESVVEHGTGTRAQIAGVAVAGKTGTADHGEPSEHLPPHSWFVSFAPAAAPTVAVSVIVEDGGGEDTTGGAVAAPIAQQLMSLLLKEKL
jgi:peptidoglycan glycosyltransferase